MARRAAHLEEDVGGERRVDAAVKDFRVGERELRVRRRVRPGEARRLAEVVGGSAEIPYVARALAAYVQVVRLRVDVRHAVERALFLRFQLAENLRRDLRRHVLLDEHHVRGVVRQRAIHQRAACHAVVQREPHGSAADAFAHATGEHVGGAEAVGHRAGGERVHDDEASLGAAADHQNARDRASDAVRDRVGDSAGELAVGVGRIGREDRDGERTRDPLRKVQELGPFDVARLGERRDALRLGRAGNERAGDERRGEYHAGLRPGPHHSWGARALGAKTARAVSRAVIVTDIDPNARFPVPRTDTTCLPGAALKTTGALPRRIPSTNTDTFSPPLVETATNPEPGTLDPTASPASVAPLSRDGDPIAPPSMETRPEPLVRAEPGFALPS